MSTCPSCFSSLFALYNLLQLLPRTLLLEQKNTLFTVIWKRDSLCFQESGVLFLKRTGARYKRKLQRELLSSKKSYSGIFPIWRVGPHKWLCSLRIKSKTASCLLLQSQKHFSVQFPISSLVFLSTRLPTRNIHLRPFPQSLISPSPGEKGHPPNSFSKVAGRGDKGRGIKISLHP